MWRHDSQGTGSNPRVSSLSGRHRWVFETLVWVVGVWDPEAVTPPPALGKTLHRLPAGVRALFPRGMRQSIRERVGPFAPWERGFSRVPPPAPPGCDVGPPDFVGIGAQKAGTSWWFELLLAHPAVYHPPGVHKERHFFAPFAVEAFESPDVDKYHGWFPRPPGTVTGEWTPDYLHQRWVAPLLAAAAPEVRLLVMVRDPIDRLLSGLAHAEMHSGSHLGEVMADAVERSFYSAPLRRFTDLFPPEKVLVLQYERCVADPLGQLERTFRFLELDELPSTPTVADVRVSPTLSAKPELSDDARLRLRDLYAADVTELTASYPDIDVDLWPNFTTGGGG